MDPRNHGVREVGRAQARIGAAALLLHVRRRARRCASAETPAPSRIARAICRSVRPAAAAGAALGPASTPCTVISASCIASWWACVAASQQRPVDVEQEQHAGAAQRSNDMPGSSRLANAAISRAAASMSSSRDHLDRRVHVAAAAPTRARWGPAAADVERVRVGPGAAAERLDRERDLLCLGGVVEQLEHPRVKRRPARDHRAGAERVLGDLPELDAGLIGGERHVDDDRHVGLVRRTRSCATPANVGLLLSDGERQ